MAERNLTFEEWSHLSEEEKGERYRELSDHDKFRVRVTMPPVAKSLRCNGCCYYQGFAKCAANTLSISSEVCFPPAPCAIVTVWLSIFSLILFPLFPSLFTVTISIFFYTPYMK